MKTAFLIEELWTDFMENESSAASGFRPIAISLTREAADACVAEGGVHPGSRWPVIQAGTPKRRVKELKLL
jgi:hypothetical protein